MSREIGAQVGDYRLLASVGAGAWGEVFKAAHVITRRIDAIKLLRCNTQTTPEIEQRYLREIQVQASLDHPNIAAVHTAFWTPEGIALVMEFVEGEPLDVVLARGGLPLATGAAYALQVLDALEYAHSRGVVHRDVKPGNILITAKGSVKLTDFGLARRQESVHLTHSGEFAGSPYYMSPEQVVGLDSADARSDIYAVGVVLYEIAVGRRPFEDASAFQVMLKHRDCPPVPPVELEPAIGAALSGVILKALEKEPGKRFPSALAFRNALELALNTPRPAPTAPPLRWRWAAAAAVLACLAGGGALAVAKYHRHAEPLPATLPVRLTASPELFDLPSRTLPPDIALLPSLEFRPAAPAVPKWKPEFRARAAPAPHALEPLPAVPLRAPVAVVEPPPVITHAAPAAPVPAPTLEPAAAPPEKKRNAVWRVLGRIPKPWGGTRTEEKPPAADQPARNGPPVQP